MKKIVGSLILVLMFVFVLSRVVQAQLMPYGMMGYDYRPAVSSTAAVQEESTGKSIWEKLQAKQINCANLSDDDFEVLGEYFMGQMLGEQHEGMNNMMIQMMGEEGEKQMHIAMGKRMSGCEPNAPMPQAMMNSNMMPMMINMMMGGLSGGQAGWSPLGNYNYSNPMMNFGYGYDGFWGLGWIFMVLWWVLIIVAIVSLIRWLARHPYKCRECEKSFWSADKSPLEILKERYARGEIDRKEFEEKKKDLA